MTLDSPLVRLQERKGILKVRLVNRYPMVRPAERLVDVEENKSCSQRSFYPESSGFLPLRPPSLRRGHFFSTFTFFFLFSCPFRFLRYAEMKKKTGQEKKEKEK